MRICIILPKGLPVPNVKGGAIETLITEIIKQNEIYKKLDITVFSVYDQRAEEKSREYKYTKFEYIKNNFSYKLKAIFVRIKNLFGNNLNTYNEVILDKIKRTKYDYILVEDGAYFSFITYLKYLKKEQMILHFHHCGVSDNITDNTYSKFIGVSDFVTNKFKESSKIKDCVTLKNGINLDRFNIKFSSLKRNELRNKLGLNKDDFVVIFCGRLVKGKGVLELIKAIKKIKNSNIKLMIVGSINFGNSQKSDYLNLLNKEIESSNGRIITTGYVNYDEIYKYYKISDVAVIPSIIEDAAPLVNIESMACGLPVMITDTGGSLEYSSKETIVISKDNIVNDIKEKVLYLYNNQEKIKEISKENVLESKFYSTENFYNNLVEILNSGVNKNE